MSPDAPPARNGPNASEPDRLAELHCKDCRYWYGAEDDEYGPCQLKHVRKDAKFVTFGSHVCDEPEARREYGVGPAPAPADPPAPADRE